MSEEFDPEDESDLRKRAAWLLGMLVLVAALVVTIMVTVLGGSGNDDNNTTVADPTLGATSPGPTSSSSPGSADRTPGSPSAGSTGASTSTSSSAPGTKTSSSSGATTSCPGQETCILKGDAGDAAAAINTYRTRNGQKAVPVAVGPKAQQCALNNGSGCDGGWAETQLAVHNGAMAVQKIVQFGKLLDPGVKSIDIGWAYDPGAKQYYFAIIRNG